MPIENDLSISIVTYNNDATILNKLFTNLLNVGLQTEILVVDNSPNSSLEKICKNERIVYIFNNKNIGYGAGHNIAIRKMLNKSKYHLVINPDVYFEDGTLEKIYNFMERNNGIGITMPKILNTDGTIQYLCKLLPSPQNLFFRRFGMKVSLFSKIIDDINAKYEMRLSGYDKIMDVPCLSGCFMFIRAEVFKKVGLFDEQFHMYMEDFDFSRRVHKYYKTVFYPEATVYHKNEKGSYKNLGLLKYHVVSAIKYFNKWGWFFDKERKLINTKML